MTLYLGDIKWYTYHGALLPSVPPHHNITLDKQTQQELLVKSGAYFIRWTDHFDLPKESSFWYVIKDKPESLESYKSKVRNQIKKGLNLCIVEPASAYEISETGYTVYRKAVIGYQHNDEPIQESLFKNQYFALQNDKNHEFWVVKERASEKVIAYAHTILDGNMCSYSSIKFDPDYLHLYGGYALIFAMNTHYLNERHFNYVSDGARSIAHSTNIQEFLIQKFQFRKAFCNLHLAYRKDIGYLVKMLYPFRHRLTHFQHPLLRKLSTLLIQEELCRTHERS
ncbi:MAG: hypothetical protein PHQ90_00975 [Sulfuricurvum sp.]|uniref:hypothetical protein n=1 Tax=Sulfuricurvum sp. TaxID=2025608 RepID=UPI00260DFD5E|nr:hypothetical protein [Sulfuricurvum sp.]MDD2367839.1 hypothetical protein [Sulfuricurvum sp.]MDD5117209.1 hypothetical protein [Sulfuricurvum sp.]